MTIIALNTKVYIDIQDRDRETVAREFDSGAERALESFPFGCVIQVDVENADALTEEQIAELGFEE